MNEPWWDPNDFRSLDLLSVAALNMRALAGLKLRKDLTGILEANRARTVLCPAGCNLHVHCLLSQIPAKASIFDPSAATHLNLANDLWTLLRDLIMANPNLARRRTFGPAGLSKMIARKRPGLVPIIDSVATGRIKRAHGGRKPPCKWSFIRNEFNRSPTLQINVATVRDGAGVPCWYEDLRIIDVVVWMRDRQAQGKVLPCLTQLGSLSR
jgi:hypothetical protein